MYDKLITPEEKKLLESKDTYGLANFQEKRQFESNRQLPNETGDEYKVRMARKEANKKSSKLSK